MQELLELSPEALESLLKRLTLHAHRKMLRIYWRGARVKTGVGVAKGYEAKDFALDAIQMAMEGTRSWNREKYQTIEAFLKSIIDSIVSHLVVSDENKRVRQLATDENDGSTFEIPGFANDSFTLLKREESQKRFRDSIWRQLEGDEFLLQLLECLEADITKPADIANMLDMEVKDVYNGKKRLRRKVEKIYRKMSPQGKAAKV